MSSPPTCPPKHPHPSLITLHPACDDPSGGRRSAQIPQLDTPHRHHRNPTTRYILGCRVQTSASVQRITTYRNKTLSSAEIALVYGHYAV